MTVNLKNLNCITRYQLQTDWYTTKSRNTQQNGNVSNTGILDYASS